GRMVDDLPDRLHVGQRLVKLDQLSAEVLELAQGTLEGRRHVLGDGMVAECHAMEDALALEIALGPGGGDVVLGLYADRPGIARGSQVCGPAMARSIRAVSITVRVMGVT